MATVAINNEANAGLLVVRYPQSSQLLTGYYWVVSVGHRVASPETLPGHSPDDNLFTSTPLPSSSMSQLRATGLEGQSTAGDHSGWPLLGANLHFFPYESPELRAPNIHCNPFSNFS